MIFKLIGGIIVLFSSWFLGYILSRDCARRPGQLRELQSLLQMLENQIGFMSEVLEEAFLNISSRSSSATAVFFQTAAGLLHGAERVDAREAWEMALKQNAGNTALVKEDLEILLAFGKMLGSSDEEGQIKNIRLTRTQLELQEKKAEEYRGRNERMYRSLGILGGIAVVLVLI